jgi:hypothetical protein
MGCSPSSRGSDRARVCHLRGFDRRRGSGCFGDGVQSPGPISTQKAYIAKIDPAPPAVPLDMILAVGVETHHWRRSLFTPLLLHTTRLEALTGGELCATQNRPRAPDSRCSFLVSRLAAVQSGERKRQPHVPYVPTTEEAERAMLKLADVKKADIVYDLGCGDGRIRDRRGEDLRRAWRRDRHRSGPHPGGEGKR